MLVRERVFIMYNPASENRNQLVLRNGPATINGQKHLVFDERGYWELIKVPSSRSAHLHLYLSSTIISASRRSQACPEGVGRCSPARRSECSRSIISTSSSFSLHHERTQNLESRQNSLDALALSFYFPRRFTRAL